MEKPFDFAIKVLVQDVVFVNHPRSSEMIPERNDSGAGGADSERKREREREHSGTWLFM
ncbi:hypothetical protein IMY05_005G0117200 [Salix suchowensis]|nr:hypothetical protein IMY05_005G0117200 [Salix suchowensis]